MESILFLLRLVVLKQFVKCAQVAMYAGNVTMGCCLNLTMCCVSNPPLLLLLHRLLIPTCG